MNLTVDEMAYHNGYMKGMSAGYEKAIIEKKREFEHEVNKQMDKWIRLGRTQVLIELLEKDWWNTTQREILLAWASASDDAIDKSKDDATNKKETEI